MYDDDDDHITVSYPSSCYVSMNRGTKRCERFRVSFLRFQASCEIYIYLARIEFLFLHVPSLFLICVFFYVVNIDSDRFTVVSYNVLGDRNSSYHKDLYSNVSFPYLKWGYRKRLICEELIRLRPDIICMQVIKTSFPSSFFFIFDPLLILSSLVKKVMLLIF